jgi:hypothetical protein
MSLIGHDNYVKTIMKKKISLDSSFNASKIKKYLLAPINMIMTNGSYRRTKIPPITKMKLFLVEGQNNKISISMNNDFTHARIKVPSKLSFINIISAFFLLDFKQKFVISKKFILHLFFFFKN